MSRGEKEPVDNEPYRRPYPIRPRYQVRHTGGLNYRREQPITHTDAGLSSSDREAALGFLKLLQEKISGASGSQTGNAGKTYAVKIDGKYVEMSAEDYAALLVRREKAKATVEGTGNMLSTKTGESKTATPKEAAKPDTEDITPIVVPPLRADGEQLSPKSGSTETKTQGEHPNSSAQ